MNTISIFRATMTPVLVLASLAAAAACGSSDPEDLTFDLEISDRSLDTEVVKVKKDDTLTVNFSSDEPGSIHLHGYDIEREISPGEPTTMVFVANATGDFKIAFHPEFTDVMAHGTAFESETLEQGDIFTFKMHAGLVGTAVPFHNHMVHEHTGTIVVSQTEPISGGAIIGILPDGSFEPPEITVRPGTTVTWTYAGGETARVASGLPAGSDTNEEAEHEHEEGGEELLLGSLEVHPR